MDIRRVTHEDVDEIVAFTEGTFEWGDYVPDMISSWVDDRDSLVVVADNGSEIAGVGRVMLMSPSEAWSHAVRVHPDHRGHGIAGDLLDTMTAWCFKRGVSIIRLLIDDTNNASKRHVTKTGFRLVATPVHASREIGGTTPNPDGNGGRRTSDVVPARRVKSADAAMLAAAWPSSECGRAMRTLVATGWQFARLTDEVAEEAARSGGLWEIGSSWAVTTLNDATFDVALLDSDPADALGAIRALIDLAKTEQAERFGMWIADIEWLTQAAALAGCDLQRYGIWVRSL